MASRRRQWMQPPQRSSRPASWRHSKDCAWIPVSRAVADRFAAVFARRCFSDDDGYQLLSVSPLLERLLVRCCPRSHVSLKHTERPPTAIRSFTETGSPCRRAQWRSLNNRGLAGLAAARAPSASITKKTVQVGLGRRRLAERALDELHRRNLFSGDELSKRCRAHIVEVARHRTVLCQPLGECHRLNGPGAGQESMLSQW